MYLYLDGSFLSCVWHGQHGQHGQHVARSSYVSSNPACGQCRGWEHFEGGTCLTTQDGGFVFLPCRWCLEGAGSSGTSDLARPCTRADRLARRRGNAVRLRSSSLFFHFFFTSARRNFARQKSRSPALDTVFSSHFCGTSSPKCAAAHFFSLRTCCVLSRLVDDCDELPLLEGNRTFSAECLSFGSVLELLADFYHVSRTGSLDLD